MYRVVAMALCAVGISGCGGTALRANWADRGLLKMPSKKEAKGAPAVYLVKEIRAQMVNPPGSQPYSQWHHHDAIAILNEKGYKYADVRVSYPKKGKIVDFSARTIGKNGRITMVKPKKVYDDEAKVDEERRFKVRVFAFPKVEVGSVLEYRYTIQYPWITHYLERYINDDIPVRKYVVALEGTQEVRFAVRAYNVKKGTKPWVVGSRGDRWTVDWTLNNIPAKKSLSFGGSRSLSDPPWAFSVGQLEWGGIIRPINRDWDSAVGYRGKELYEKRDEWFKGFVLRPDYKDAKTKRQKIERTVEFLTEVLPYRSDWSWPGRKAKQIQEAAEASGIEKSRLLYELLSKEGITAHFALASGFGEALIDKTYPQVYDFDRLVVKVPKQPGIDTPLWIDPACETCALGQLPFWLYDVEALVVTSKKEGLSTEAEYLGKFEAVKGEITSGGGTTYRYVADLSPQGDLSVQTKLIETGYDAQLARMNGRTKTTKEWTKSAESFVANRIDKARLSAQSPSEIDDSAWVSTRSLEFSAPGHGVLDNGRVVFGLDVFEAGWDRRFKGKGKRKKKIYVTRPYDFTEELVLRLPPGWTVSGLPASQTTKSAPFVVSVQVEEKPGEVILRRSIRGQMGKYSAKKHLAQVRKALSTFRSFKDLAVTAAPKPE